MKKGLSNIWISTAYFRVVSINYFNFFKDLTPLLFNMKTKKRKKTVIKSLNLVLLIQVTLDSLKSMGPRKNFEVSRVQNFPG